MPPPGHLAFDESSGPTANALSAQSGNPLFKDGRNSIHGTVIEHWRRLAPFDAGWINRSRIPQVSAVLAAAWVISMKLLQLLLQLSGDHVVLVPELHRT